MCIALGTHESEYTRIPRFLPATDLSLCYDWLCRILLCRESLWWKTMRNEMSRKNRHLKHRVYSNWACNFYFICINASLIVRSLLVCMTMYSVYIYNQMLHASFIHFGDTEIGHRSIFYECSSHSCCHNFFLQLSSDALRPLERYLMLWFIEFSIARHGALPFSHAENISSQILFCIYSI